MDNFFSSISLRDAGTALLDLAMPRRCIACRRPLTLRERFICLPCLADFPFTHYWELPHNPMADKFNVLIQHDLDSTSASGTPQPVLSPSCSPPDVSGTNPSVLCSSYSPPDDSGTNPSVLCPSCSSPDDSGTNPPVLCPSCSSPDDSGTNPPVLCPSCSPPDDSGTDRPVLCSFCPPPDDSGTNPPVLCSSDPPLASPSDNPPCGHEPYAFAAALFFYNSASDYRHIPWHLKYEGGLAAGRHFAHLLGECLAASPQFADVDVVIPVPLHWTRQWRRGYNQAEVIAREVADVLGAQLRTDILRRARRTRSQVHLSVPDKAANVRGAFSLRPTFFRPNDLRHNSLLLGSLHLSPLRPHSLSTNLVSSNHLSPSPLSPNSFELDPHNSGPLNPDTFCPAPSTLHTDSFHPYSLRPESLQLDSLCPNSNPLQSDSIHLSSLPPDSLQPNSFHSNFQVRHILLIDDTFTTGSTLNACRSVLRQAFPLPTRISVATLAFVAPD